MSIQGGTRKLSTPNLKRIYVTLIAVDLAVIAGAGLWLGPPDAGGPIQWLSISHVFLGDHGTATFYIHSSGVADQTISAVRAQGPGIEPGVSANLYSGNVVPYKSSLNLTVSFPAVNWQDGATYHFTLIDSQGNQFPTSIIAR